MDETIDFMALGAISRVMYFLMVMFAIWLLARLLDKLGGQNFKEMMRKIADDSIALSIYLGLRFVGIAYGASTILS